MRLERLSAESEQFVAVFRVAQPEHAAPRFFSSVHESVERLRCDIRADLLHNLPRRFTDLTQ